MGKAAGRAAETAAKSQATLAQRSMDVGEQLLKEAAPARQTAQEAYKTGMGTYSAIATGKPGELQRAVAPSINAATGQFYMARRNALNMPPGGARDQALRDLKMGEASTKSSIYSGGVSDALSRLVSGGQGGGTEQGLAAFGQAGAGFGSATQSYSQLASAQASSAGQAAAGAGTAIAAIAIMA